MREGITSRVTVADKPCGEFYDFYSVSLEKFKYHLVLMDVLVQENRTFNN
jgi:hypothetical protein